MGEVFEFVPGESDVLPDPAGPSEPLLPYIAPEPAPPPIKRRIKVKGTGLMRAMRHVMINEDPRHDRSPMDRMARKWLDNDLHKFMTKFEAMEREEAERLGRAKDVDEVDMGHDEAVKVLERLLKEAAKG